MNNINRIVRKTEISPGVFRYRIIITSMECQKDTHESNVYQGMFVKWLGDNLGLLMCGYKTFSKLSVFHNGECWTCEAEAEVDESGG